MKKLLVYIRDFRLECVLAPLFKLLEASFELIVPLIMAAIIDRGIPSGDTGFIVRMCLWLVVLGGVGLLSSVTAQYFSAKAAIGFSAKLRHVLMAHIQTLSYTELDTVGTSTLITRMNSDINQVQTGVNMCLRLLLRSPFVVFGAMIMAFTVDSRAALWFAAAIPVLSVVVFGIMLVSMPLYKKVQQLLDKVLGITRENLTGVRVIRAFGKEAQETADFTRKNEEFTAAQKHVGRISALMNPVTYVIINLAILALIHTGALRVEAGVITQGAVVALYNYMSQILVELIKLANLIINITKAVACGNRIQSVLEMPSGETVDAQYKKEASPYRVEFRHAGICYAGAGAESLTDVSFAVRPGQTVGVIGGTGSGKSTLVNLIPRFYDVSEGAVLIDGQDVRGMEVSALRARIGVTPQKAVLFQGTIRDNLRWGNESATDEELLRAVETAQASDVLSTKGGLDAQLEQGGRNLSGGQRQRLTIARALVRKPDILILDDSASALDFATDAALRKALKNLPEQPTVFIVSQRTSSIQQADQIIVLDDGAVAGVGTHQQLLDSCQVYREIYDSQFKKEARA